MRPAGDLRHELGTAHDGDAHSCHLRAVSLNGRDSMMEQWAQFPEVGSGQIVRLAAPLAGTSTWSGGRIHSRSRL